jgi:hypothetical protein
MSTTFPTSIQDLDATRGSSSSTLNNPSHVTHHTTEDDTIEALQAKVGVDNSAVTSSLDYITSHLPVANINATGTPSSSTYLRGDGAWTGLVPETISLYTYQTTNYHDGYTSDTPGAYFFSDSSGTTWGFAGSGIILQRRSTTADWAVADNAPQAVLYGAYLYVQFYDTGTTSMRVYRFDKTNIAAGGTLMTTSGQAFGTNATGYASSRMVCDSSGNFYFTYQAGNSANSYVVSKYTVSGTVFTFVSNITCGSDTAYLQRFICVDSSGNIYGFNLSDSKIRKFNSSGTIQAPTSGYEAITADLFMYINGTAYARRTSVAGEIYQRINI